MNEPFLKVIDLLNQARDIARAEEAGILVYLLDSARMEAEDLSKQIQFKVPPTKTDG